MTDYKQSLTGERSALAEKDVTSAIVVRARQAEFAALGADIPIDQPRGKRKKSTPKHKNAKATQVAAVADDAPGIKLYHELAAARADATDFGNNHPLRTLIRQLNDVVNGNARAEEIAMARIERDRLKAVLKDQDSTSEAVSVNWLILAAETIDTLFSELDGFRNVYRSRSIYFRALQKLSDSVKDFDVQDSKSGSITVEIASQKELQGVFHLCSHWVCSYLSL